MPHQYAIGRSEELVGYIDLVTEKAYSYNDGRPSDEIALPEDIASASRRRAPRCSRRSPTSTTT